MAFSQTAVDLRWKDNSANETGFKIERRQGAGAFAEIASRAANVVAYRDATGLTAGTSYVYRVRAYNGGGASAPSNEATVTTLPEAPAAPSNLAAQAESQAEIRLTWEDKSGSEDGFKVERKKAGGTFSQIAVLGTSVVAYRDVTGLSASTGYVYRVRSFNAGGSSAPSNEATAVTLPALPAAPSTLTASLTEDTLITLRWRDNSNNESGFRLERKKGDGAFQLSRDLPAGTTSHGDNDLQPSTAYTYRVRAFNAGGESANSNEAALATPAALGGTLQVLPEQVKFGKVKVKKTKAVAVTLKNASTTERLRVSMQAPAAPFALEQPPATLELGPGEQRQMLVNFRPTKRKKYGGSINVLSSDPSKPKIQIPLKGTGT